MVGIGISPTEHVSSCLDSRLQEERREQEEWEVYEVGGQRRVRTIDMLEGGVQTLPNAAVNTDGEANLDTIVDVEGDAEAVYGKAQYTEADLHNPDATSASAKPSGKPSWSVANGQIFGATSASTHIQRQLFQCNAFMRTAKSAGFKLYSRKSSVLNVELLHNLPTFGGYIYDNASERE
jgi:hypothetical protein